LSLRTRTQEVKGREERRGIMEGRDEEGVDKVRGESFVKDGVGVGSNVLID
jgi:hypothetical protein